MSKSSVNQTLSVNPTNLVFIAGLTLLLNALASLTFTAVSVVTPFIGTSLGMSAEDELWLTDAFLIALICVTPVSGYLLSALGMRRLLVTGVIGTTGFFTLGAFAPTVYLLTAACFIVGLFSGVLTPATQVLILDSYPKEKRATAMAVWGAGTTIGILLGAALTGLLVQTASWRHVFLIGLPFGLAACLVIRWLRSSEKPHVEVRARADRVELALLLTFILTLGVFLNLGDNYGWFRSPFIVLSLLLSAGSLLLYVWYSRRHASSVLDLAVLRDTPFATAAALTLGAAFFSTGQFEIDLLGGLLAVHADVLSLRSSLGGAALLAGVVLGGVLLHYIKPEPLIILSLIVALTGKYAFTHYGYDMSAIAIIWPQVVSGFGLGLLATPLAVLAYETLAKSLTNDGASLFVMATQLGYAFGIAVLGIVLNYLQTDVGVRSPESVVQPFLAIFWIELFGTALLIPWLLLPTLSKRLRR